MADCCGSTTKKTIILSCSGASDVGALADRVSRAFAKDGKGSLICLAAIGAGIEEKLKILMSADEVVTIDGCGLVCAKKMVEKAGRSPKVIELSRLGYLKGKTPMADDTVFVATGQIAKQLEGFTEGAPSASCCCS
jgi:uncharacterized metal-binding protein